MGIAMPKCIPVCELGDNLKSEDVTHIKKITNLCIAKKASKSKRYAIAQHDRHSGTSEPTFTGSKRKCTGPGHRRCRPGPNTCEAEGWAIRAKWVYVLVRLFKEGILHLWNWWGGGLSTRWVGGERGGGGLAGGMGWDGKVSGTSIDVA